MYNWVPINPPSADLGSKGLSPPLSSPISRPPAHKQVGHQQMVSLFVISGPCSQDKPTHIENDIPTLDHFSPWSLLPLSSIQMGVSLQSHAGDVWTNSPHVTMCSQLIFFTQTAPLLELFTVMQVGLLEGGLNLDACKMRCFSFNPSGGSSK